MMTKNDTTPRAWVGCLGCYAAGRLVGEWVDGNEIETFTDAPQDVTTLPDEHDAEGHEEWWIFDHENYGPLLTGETSPAEAQRLAELLEDLSEDEREPFGHYVDNGDEPDVDAFRDAYAGEWKDIADFAYELAEDIGAVPDAGTWPLSCIDWERAGNELMMDGYWAVNAQGGGIYVFRAY